MPDWSYRTLFRPCLFRLSPEKAQALTLNSLGTLARLPLGPQLLEMMGDMQPPPQLCCQLGGMELASPVGLGAGLEGQLYALRGLERFGFGFIEIGPVALEAGEGLLIQKQKIERLIKDQAISYPALPANIGLASVISQLKGCNTKGKKRRVALGIRLGYQPGTDWHQATLERCKLVEQLASYASFFTVEIPAQSQSFEEEVNWSTTQWQLHLEQMLATIKRVLPTSACPLFVVIPPDLEVEECDRLLKPALELGVSGVVVSGGLTRAIPSRRLVGKPSHHSALALVQYLREKWGQELIVIGSGGIMTPKDALRFFKAGADLVQLHSGFIYSGPGLPKRINEALAYYIWNKTSEPEASKSEAPFKQKELELLSNLIKFPAWFYAFIFGLAMIISGGLVWLVGATRVVLPYDERYLGLSRRELNLINLHLLDFLSHDRISLAGTMIAGGIFFAQLGRFTIRQGVSWGRRTFAISGIFGFASFFLFLGFGYFDELHALLSVMLLPFFLLGLGRNTQSHLQTHPREIAPPNLTNSWRWRLGLWGQLLFVILGLGLIVAGGAIAFLGATTVFVPEDLAFMQTSLPSLQKAGANLVPVIAHDRAGFGGALVTDGLAVLFMALWGYRQSARWLWWTFFAAGTIAFFATTSVHLVVGYTDLFHLLPVLIGIALYLPALVISYPYLCYSPPPLTGSSLKEGKENRC